MPIISAAFQKVTNNKFPRFGNWDRAVIDLPKQAGPNDCMFFLWKYMEFWDGNHLNIDINPVSYYFTIFIFSICACDFSNPYLPFFSPCALLFVPFFLQFKGMIYMIELMHYCIFHALNQAKLPDELDVYRLGGRKIVFEWITMIVCNMMLEQSVVAINCHWYSVWCWTSFMVHFSVIFICGSNPCTLTFATDQHTGLQLCVILYF